MLYRNQTPHSFTVSLAGWQEKRDAEAGDEEDAKGHHGEHEVAGVLVRDEAELVEVGEHGGFKLALLVGVARHAAGGGGDIDAGVQRIAGIKAVTRAGCGRC